MQSNHAAQCYQDIEEEDERWLQMARERRGRKKLSEGWQRETQRPCLDLSDPPSDQQTLYSLKSKKKSSERGEKYESASAASSGEASYCLYVSLQVFSFFFHPRELTQRGSRVLVL